MSDFYVLDSYRTNMLSHIDGGFDVKIIFINQKSRIYRNVHYPLRFFEKAKSNDKNVVDYENLGKSINKVYTKNK